MKRYCIILFVSLIWTYSYSQTLDDLEFGTDTTFDVVTWNIEWFPKNGQNTVNSVAEIIAALDADLLALQEIDDKEFFNQLVDMLDGYEAYYVNDEYSGLAFIYKTPEVYIEEVFEIYTNSGRIFPRAPVVFKVSFENEDYTFINNHLKCCGDGVMNHNDSWDEETRRYDACVTLDDYIESSLPNEKVILLGDLNDILTDNASNNVFEVFLDDPQHYQFADLDVAQGTSLNWSYPTWPSHLDHILLSDEIFGGTGSYECQTLRIDDYLPGGFWEYIDNVTDHRPVGLKLHPEVTDVDDFSSSNNRFINTPNPFFEKTTFSFDASSKSRVIEIYNSQGQKVETIVVDKGQTSYIWNASTTAKGMYFVQMIEEGKVAGMRKVVKL